MNAIKDRLKQLREAKGATQQQVAEGIGKSIKAYAKYEEGRAIPPTKDLPVILEYFEVSYEDFINVKNVK